jgi:hypothetical protein
MMSVARECFVVRVNYSGRMYGYAETLSCVVDTDKELQVVALTWHGGVSFHGTE